MGERYLKSVRLLAECIQGFERYTSEAIRNVGLTSPQFDIIATLGNTPGMNYKELGEKTLITKGTLTGVIERLEQKGLVSREQSPDDKRSYFVRLTPEGERTFEDVFPRVIGHGKQLFASYGEEDFEALDAQLRLLRDTIRDGSARSPSTFDSEPTT